MDAQDGLGIGSLKLGYRGQRNQIPDSTASTVTVPIMRANTVLWDCYLKVAGQQYLKYGGDAIDRKTNS